MSPVRVGRKIGNYIFFFKLLLAIITFQLYSIEIILLFPSMGNSDELCMYFTLGHLYGLMH